MGWKHFYRTISEEESQSYTPLSFESTGFWPCQRPNPFSFFLGIIDLDISQLLIKSNGNSWLKKRLTILILFPMR